MAHRFPAFAKAFPVHTLKASEVPSFFLTPNLRTLPARFGEAYFETFVYREGATGQKKSAFFWVILHGIGLAGTCGMLIHRKHSKYATARNQKTLQLD
mmetsp:Transcript_29/g.102  ORF Transcript_29/g.102 Transcript_29/m.102 type:complete len:98 (-) Transcript_29:265-558(-)